MNFIVRLAVQLLTLVAGYVAIFAQLHRPLMRIWDESRLANNAIEMYYTGWSLVTTYNYSPDLWNTKPPLLIWLQMLSIHVFGISEFSVRLPSAIAGALTCLLIYVFCAKVLKNFWMGILSVWMLITTESLLFNHGMRTADYDSLLILFMLSASMCYYLFCKNTKLKYYYTFVILTIGAVLTKGIAGLLFLPSLFLFTLYKKQLVDRLHSRHTYIGIGLFIGFVGGYYGMREFVDPGYLVAVAENELGGRFLKTLENHKHGFFYYFKNVFTEFMIPWAYVGYLGLIIPFLFKKSKVNNHLMVWIICHVLVYMFIISSGQTKLEWYDHPVYPFLALSGSYSLVIILSNLKRYWKVCAISSLVFFVGWFYLSKMDTYLQLNQESDDSEYILVKYLHQCISNNDIAKFEGTNIIYRGYDAHVKFYVEIMKDKGIMTQIVPNRHFNTTKIVVADEGYKKYIDETYFYRMSQQVGPVNHVDLHFKKAR